jgi:hypothetical protein
MKKIGEKKITQNIIAIKFKPHLQELQFKYPHLKIIIKSIIMKSNIENIKVEIVIIIFVFVYHFVSSESPVSSFSISKLHLLLSQ